MSRGRQVNHQKGCEMEEGEGWGEAETSNFQEQKRSWSRVGGNKGGRQSWPFEGGDWPESSNKNSSWSEKGGWKEGRQNYSSEGGNWAEAETEKKRSWSRAGGRKEGRQSWPFEGGDWPEAETDRRKGSSHIYAESSGGNHRQGLEGDVIGGKVEDASAHWSQRKLPDPPKVQLEDQKKKQRYLGKKGGSQDKSRYRRDVPPSNL